jgi:uncharacterized RDD family membrane protein YckC
MDSKDYSAYSLQELYDLYVKTDKDLNPAEHKLIYEAMTKKERVGLATLASLSDRFLASLIDGLISNIPATLITMILFGANNPLDIFRGRNFPITLVWLFLFELIFILVNWKLLYNNGQTIGKKYMGIKIVSLDNSLPPFTKSYGARYLAPALIGLIPIIGSIFAFADILFIFTDKRRCLHDRIAGTKVITCGTSIE